MTSDRWIRLIAGAGIGRALTPLASRPGLLVLAYHRIGTAVGQSFDDELFSADAAAFRAQLLYLRAHFDIVSAESLLAAIEGDRLSCKRASVLITFDDGYRDNCEVAMPILKALDLPALFFIAAGYLDRPRLTWWDRVAFIVKTTTRQVLELDYPIPTTIDLRTVGRHDATRAILRLYKQASAIDQQRFFERLEDQAGVDAGSTWLGRDLFMTWDHARTLRQAGFAIGAHTYDHPVLSQIPEEAQRIELQLSKQRLEEEIGVPVRLMSYPVGGPGAFDTVTQRLAREAGYAAAFSYYGGCNRPRHRDLFDLRRVPVERGDSLSLFRSRVNSSNLFG